MPLAFDADNFNMTQEYDEWWTYVGPYLVFLIGYDIGFARPLPDHVEREEDIVSSTRWREYDIFMDEMD
jgi:hypothetical protein